MLKTLELENCFTHKKLKVDFSKGMTAILGLNGSGKSLILEMIQYALWGSSALRGLAEDYKGMIVNLTFEVKGVEYSVRRAGSTVRLTSGTADLASGTKAVNPYIASLFGYSFEVFKMANAVNQGKIEELGDMLPTARKKLVDQTIGLDRMDLVSDWLSDKTKELRAQITAAEKYLLAPIEPGEFHVKQTAAELKLVLDHLQVQVGTYRTLMSQANVALVAPQEAPGDLTALEATQSTRQTLLGQQRSIQQALTGFPELGPQPEPHMMAKKLHELIVETEFFKESMTQKAQIDKMLEGMPLPRYSEEQVVAAEAALLLAQRWDTKAALTKKVAEYVCPACDHHWHDEDPRLKDYADVPTERPVALISSTVLPSARKALATIETRQGLVEALALLQERLQGKNDYTMVIAAITKAGQDRRLYDERLLQEGRRLELVTQLNALEIPADQEKVISALRSYQTAKLDYDRQLLERDTAKLALSQLPADLAEQVELMAANYTLRVSYEGQVTAYIKAAALYALQLEEVERDRSSLTQWDLCKQAVVMLRQRVKGYLLPSLNKVASGLLQTMTAGKLTWMVVSENFDITVDGQRLETLSGAGKSVANLALRIGLGQVLTNRTFSVLMLDEIDASCDEERAQAIAESLQRLTGQIGQILQVSHKQGLVADHYVRL